MAITDKTAKIEVSPDYNLPLIAERAGNGDFNARLYRDGFLYVEGVTQRALDTALKNYDDEVDGYKLYINQRVAEYPDVGDQLDAIWKELNARRLKGEDLVQDADDMLGRILAVKHKYPKES